MISTYNCDRFASSPVRKINEVVEAKFMGFRKFIRTVDVGNLCRLNENFGREALTSCVSFRTFVFSK